MDENKKPKKSVATTLGEVIGITIAACVTAIVVCFLGCATISICSGIIGWLF